MAIDEKKLIEELQRFSNSNEMIEYTTAYDVVQDCIGIVENQPKTDCSECSGRKFYQQGYQDGLNADKWIPCEERLPSDTEIHEVTAKFINGRLYTDFAYYDESREEWWKLDDDGTVNAIAWKEHSEPYKKEGAE